MISAGFYGVYSELAPTFERASGNHLVRIEISQSRWKP
jgi:molybdate transport system substrate-binding protein